jgi:hypothetical protein
MNHTVINDGLGRINLGSHMLEGVSPPYQSPHRTEKLQKAFPVRAMGLLHEHHELASVYLTLCEIEVLKEVDAIADANLFHQF